MYGDEGGNAKSLDSTSLPFRNDPPGALRGPLRGAFKLFSNYKPMGASSGPFGPTAWISASQTAQAPLHDPSRDRASNSHPEPKPHFPPQS